MLNGGFPGGSAVKNPLPKQETQVQSLIREDLTCQGATKPIRHCIETVL